MLKDYYRVMGLTSEATGDEVKKAYRRLAMEFHPDRNQNDPGCEERLKEINEAYQVLGDEQKRRQYDFFCRQSFNRHVYDEADLSDGLIEIFRGFALRGFGMRGLGGCRGRGFGRRGCGRWKGIF